VYVSVSKYLKERCGSAADGNMAYGLYASRQYLKGDVIQEYKGRIISEKESNEKRRNIEYMFDVRQGRKILFVIDAGDPKNSSAARYANSVLDFHDKDRNAEYVQHDRKIYLVASKRVRPNEELLSFYGENTENIICSGR
jgi:SET domain-containing protein